MMRRLLPLMLFLSSLLPAEAQRSSDALDNVLEHTPIASVFLLKACGVDNQTPWGELVLTAGASYLIGTMVTYPMKEIVNERRPDGSNEHSFPSGHTMFAFTGATVLRHEFGHVSPWITIGGYSLATLVAADRVRRRRHYTHDVLAGAAIGILGTELTYYLKKKLFKSENVDLTFVGNGLELAIKW